MRALNGNVWPLGGLDVTADDRHFALFLAVFLFIFLGSTLVTLILPEIYTAKALSYLQSRVNPETAQSIMRDELPKNGLVCFFDILGFHDIAAVESDEAIARVGRLVGANLVAIPHIQRSIVEQFGGPPLLKAIGACAFADSILLWCEGPPADFEVYFWLTFFRVCAELMKRFFNGGLPLRGAISAGRFVVQDHCFFGKPIIEAHDWAPRTQWSGCIVEPTAQQRIDHLLSDAEGAQWRTNFERVSVSYGIPLKTPAPDTRRATDCQPSLAIKWYYYDLAKAKDDMGDEIQVAVRRSFAKHGKEIAENVGPKVDNTIRFLTFLDGLYSNSNSPRKKD